MVIRPESSTPHPSLLLRQAARISGSSEAVPDRSQVKFTGHTKRGGSGPVLLAGYSRNWLAAQEFVDLLLNRRKRRPA